MTASPQTRRILFYLQENEAINNQELSDLRPPP
ncbi:winged helix-turn-helix transcriptional regulator [Klebsiella grimontii]